MIKDECEVKDDVVRKKKKSSYVLARLVWSLDTLKELRMKDWPKMF